MSDEAGTVVTVVPPDRVGDVWHLAAPMVEAALGKGVGQFDLADIRAMIERSERQLWICVRGRALAAVCCTRVVEHPKKRSLYVSHFCGDLAAVPEMWPHVRDFARHWGCSFVMQEGRRGWGGKGIMPPEFRHAADLWVAEVD
jgi:hypothetical protein